MSIKRRQARAINEIFREFNFVCACVVQIVYRRHMHVLMVKLIADRAHIGVAKLCKVRFIPRVTCAFTLLIIPERRFSQSRVIDFEQQQCLIKT